MATHRAGNDCTFSAPKSVSIAYAAGVEGIKEAHDTAMLSVLGHLEEHYSHYRSPEGIRQGGMVAAKSTMPPPETWTRNFIPTSSW